MTSRPPGPPAESGSVRSGQGALRVPPLSLLALFTFSGTLAMHIFVPALSPRDHLDRVSSLHLGRRAAPRPARLHPRRAALVLAGSGCVAQFSFWIAGRRRRR